MHEFRTTFVLAATSGQPASTFNTRDRGGD
jgi:hypothetical protein